MKFTFLFWSCVPTNIKQHKLLSADLEPNFIQVEAKWSPSSAKLGHLRGYFGLLEAILGACWGLPYLFKSEENQCYPLFVLLLPLSKPR